MAEAQQDYIVVGAGSAGAALAARLTEDPNTRVLLVEAGRASHPVSRFPISFGLLIDNPAAAARSLTICHARWVVKPRPWTPIKR